MHKLMIIAMQKRIVALEQDYQQMQLVVDQNDSSEKYSQQLQKFRQSLTALKEDLQTAVEQNRAELPGVAEQLNQLETERTKLLSPTIKHRIEHMAVIRSTWCQAFAGLPATHLR